MANLASTVWIPAFAGMTGEGREKGFCRSLFWVGFGLRTHVSPLWDCRGKFRFDSLANQARHPKPSTNRTQRIPSRARVRVSRAQARLCGRDARAPQTPLSRLASDCIPMLAHSGIAWANFVLSLRRTKPAIRSQVQIEPCGSPLPLWAYKGRFTPLGARASSPAEPRLRAAHPHPSLLP